MARPAFETTPLSKARPPIILLGTGAMSPACAASCGASLVLSGIVPYTVLRLLIMFTRYFLALVPLTIHFPTSSPVAFQVEIQRVYQRLSSHRATNMRLSFFPVGDSSHSCCRQQRGQTPSRFPFDYERCDRRGKDVQGPHAINRGDNKNSLQVLQVGKNPRQGWQAIPSSSG